MNNEKEKLPERRKMLSDAVFKNELVEVQKLLETGADLNGPEGNGENILDEYGFFIKPDMLSSVGLRRPSP